ncbi:3'-5' exonuclease [Brucellaceae bacterium C25G]
MKLLTGQFELFDSTISKAHTAETSVKKRKIIEQAASEKWDAEAAAQRLEDTDNYKVLRRLIPRAVIDRAESDYPRLGVIIDTETTGLQYKNDEVIEIGAVAFTYSDEGKIGDVVGTYSGLQQPSLPMPPEITRLTGITDEMVAGQHFDIAALEAFIEPADLIIAHNAGFDRPFCEKLSSAFISKAWACSVKEINWSALGFEGSKLGYLIGQSGLFHTGHRASDDCYALLEVLDRKSKQNDYAPFAELLRTSKQRRVRIFAENAPFDLKDHLKARGYRWSDGTDGRPKAWWIEVDDQAYDDELNYLRTDIYRWKEAQPLTVYLTAHDRFRG